MNFDLDEALPLASAMCSSCPFRTDGKALPLEARTMDRIKADLSIGHNHICHHHQLRGKNKYVKTCRGGRDFQLHLWHALGMIAEPTDAALYAAMRAAGIEPVQDGK